MLETCAVCGAEVPFKHTVHVMLNPGGEEGVLDHYVCRSCYDDDLAPLFAPTPAASGASEQRGEADAGEEALADDSGGEIVMPGDESPDPED